MALSTRQKKFRKLHKNKGDYGESITTNDSTDLSEKSRTIYRYRW